MNKKITALSSAAFAGLAVLALAAAPTAAYADDSATTSATGTSNNTLEVTAGGLNLSGTTNGSFGSTTVADIHSSGFDSKASGKSISEQPVVSDFSGDTGAWTLNVTSDGVFANQLGADLSISDSGSAADKFATSAALGTSTEAKTIGTTATQVANATNANGVTNLSYAVDLSVPAGTNAKTQTYTDTLTWTLGTSVSEGEGEGK
ncbi:MAG: WxL domain-containing protein [Bifidobacteriaceae bacterium]|nr:WxL domain-containing protein [Bifidobacteriaceae bacterium]